MKDLSKYQQAVWEAKSLDDKRDAMIALIEASDALPETKQTFIHRVEGKTSDRLDFMAANYGLSGEGMKVS